MSIVHVGVYFISPFCILLCSLNRIIHTKQRRWNTSRYDSCALIRARIYERFVTLKIKLAIVRAIEKPRRINYSS